MRMAIAAAVNDREVLAECLQRSPDIVSGKVTLRTYEDYPSASIAYNRAIDECGADILILVHQDVYLPSGYVQAVSDRLRELEAIDPDWAIAGISGLDSDDHIVGNVWSTGIGKLVATECPLPVQAETLDELLIILRIDSGLRFDPGLPGFHMYAADIVQIAKTAGRTSWAIDAPAIHHDRPVLNLGGGYRQAWYYLRRKWRDRLPIPNLVCTLTKSPFKVLTLDLAFRVNNRGRKNRPKPTSDPVEISRRLGLEA